MMQMISTKLNRRVFMFECLNYCVKELYLSVFLCNLELRLLNNSLVRVVPVLFLLGTCRV